MLVAVDAGTSRAAPVRMAVMGDSISAGNGVSGGSPNWVAQLNATGAISFNDLAMGGATSSSVVSSQLATAFSLAQNDLIDDSLLMIGGNDAAAAYGLSIALGGDPTPFINNYVNNVKTVIDAIALANPGVHQVFANMPDVTVTPAVQNIAAGYGVPLSQLQLLSNAIAAADAQANAYALAHGVPVVDMYTASQVIVNLVPFTFGGHTFTTALAPDDFHPSVFAQGLLANLVDTAFNEGFGQSLPLLSDQTIVANAGYTPNADTTYFYVQPFVLLPVPEPATGLLAMMACTGTLAYRLIRPASRQMPAGERLGMPVRNGRCSTPTALESTSPASGSLGDSLPS